MTLENNNSGMDNDNDNRMKQWWLNFLDSCHLVNTKIGIVGEKAQSITLVINKI